MAESPVLDRVRALVTPIASDLQLDVYDIEQRGGTLRITLDTRPGADGGIDLEQLALATRLISREFDHTDPIPGRYTLEVSSPGVERTLRTADHFARAVGERVTVRLVGPDDHGRRRHEGTLVAATDTEITLAVDGEQRTLPLSRVERAKTIFEWGPAPKPGKGPKPAKRPAATPVDAAGAADQDEEPGDEELGEELDGEFDELDGEDVDTDDPDDTADDADIDEEETETP